MNYYLKLILIPLSAGLLNASAVAGTTKDWWPIGVSFVGALAAALTTYLLNPPKKERNESDSAVPPAAGD